MSHEHTEPRASAVDDETTGLEFFGRWSRRKAAAARGMPDLDEPAAATADGGDAEVVAPEMVGEPVDAAPDEPPAADTGDDRIDERTGKRFSELTDADMPDPETLTADSDIRMFMARNVSPSLRMKALGQRFRHPKYNKMCICAEYADDYTNFQPLGDVVPHDLKTAIAREVEKLRDRLLGDGDEITREEAETRVLRERQHRQERYRAAAAEHKRAAARQQEQESAADSPDAEALHAEAAGADVVNAEDIAAPALDSEVGASSPIPLAERDHVTPDRVISAAPDGRSGKGESS